MALGLALPTSTARFPSYIKFTERYCDGRQGNFGWEANGATNLEVRSRAIAKTRYPRITLAVCLVIQELNSILENELMLRCDKVQHAIALLHITVLFPLPRRTKADMLRDLPPKTYHFLPLQPSQEGLREIQRIRTNMREVERLIVSVSAARGHPLPFIPACFVTGPGQRAT